MIIYQAVRSEELAALETTDLKLREGKIIIQSKRRSNERTLKLEGFQIIDFMDYLNETRQALLEINKKCHPELVEGSKLFFTKNGGMNFSNIITKLIESLKQHNNNVKDIKQIRASVITNWLQQYNLRQVQYMAGHRYVKIGRAHV